MNKEIIIALMWLITSNTVLSQQSGMNYIDVCHDKQVRLSCVKADDFAFLFTNGLFSGFKTEDNLLQYHEAKKEFIVKNNVFKQTQDSFVVIQLTVDGILVKNKDSSYLIGRNVNFSEEPPQFTITNFYNFYINVDYTGREVSHVTFNVGLKKIILPIFRFKDGSYHWVIEGFSNEQKFDIDYRYSKLLSIYFRNDQHKQGFNLHMADNGRYFDLLETFQVNSEGITIPNSERKMVYNEKGVAAIQKSSFETKNCECK